MTNNVESEVQEFKRHAEQLSRRLTAISEATLNSVIPVNRFTAKNRYFSSMKMTVKPPFCRSRKPCGDKRLKRTHSRVWRLCTSMEGCNQRSDDRRDGY